MFRILMALVALCVFADVSSAQLFPNAPWNRNSATARFDNSACPGGVCPVPGQGLGVLRPNVNVSYYGGPQWTWQGDLATHLATEHGMALPPAPAPQYATSSYAAAPSSNYYQVRSGGSTGSARVSGGSTGSYVVRSGGCTGSSLRVGCPDIDGAIVSSIISVGSTASPQLAPYSQAQLQGIQPLAIGDRIAFRRSLLEAARNARKSGEITSIQFFMLSAASRNPNVLDKMQQAVHEAAIEEGLATAQAIDWNGLISFIEKLIPIIIQLIDLFS